MAKKNDWIPKLTKIDDPIAEAKLPFRRRNGSWGHLHTIVGRPRPTLDGKDYYCPIQMKGCFKGVMPVVGVGPVDSLMNAMAVVRRYDDYLNGQLDFLPEHYERPTLRRWRFKRLPDS